MKRADKLIQSTRYTREDSPAICALVDYAAQNPGLNPRDYFELGYDRDGSGRRAFNEERASITRDFRRFRLALAEASAEGVTDAHVIAEAPHAFAGRLLWRNTVTDYKGTAPNCTPVEVPSEPYWSYTTGQYWPTEYRKAAATVLEYALSKLRRERPPVRQMPRSIAELKQRNKENGGHYFDADTMQFFRSRIESGIIGGCYFISSEQFNDNSPRKYSVRKFNAEGDISDVSKFQEFDTRSEAVDFARAMAESDRGAAAINAAAREVHQ